MLGAYGRARRRWPPWWGIRGLVAALPAGLPRVGGIGMDATVVAFAVLPWVMTAIASLPAALLVGRQSIAGALASADAAALRHPARGRRLLVVVQVALAVAIVASAGVLVRTWRGSAPSTPALPDRLLFAEGVARARRPIAPPRRSARRDRGAGAVAARRRRRP